MRTCNNNTHLNIIQMPIFSKFVCSRLHINELARTKSELPCTYITIVMIGFMTTILCMNALTLAEQCGWQCSIKWRGGIPAATSHVYNQAKGQLLDQIASD